jgi:hypothetical protein
MAYRHFHNLCRLKRILSSIKEFVPVGLINLASQLHLVLGHTKAKEGLNFCLAHATKWALQ